MRAGETVGHYRIDRTLGAGGMGVVYDAFDLTLERRVAIKFIHEALGGADMRARFWREARAAAALNHPAICQIHEIGEQGDDLYIVMERLEGEPLSDRLAHGPLPLDDVLRLAFTLLDGLAALHRRDLVHRDLKPSNVFLLADGRAKMLDFGLVLPIDSGASKSSGLTQTGLQLGSPGYMAPEQLLGEPMDARTDLFSLAVVLHEALAGVSPFPGATDLERLTAVLHGRPQPLSGSTRLEAVGRVLARAMARRPDERPASAEAMADALRTVPPPGSTPVPVAADPLVRLAVLPFRMLRADAEKEFLCASLADAIALSLAGIHSLVVRSTLTSARFASATPDLADIASALDVDVVLSGTLLPIGDRCRLAAQLVEAPGGRVLWTEQSDVTSADAFELQDTLTRRIVESLKLPLSMRERRALGKDVPANAAAYELFLRANRAAFPGRDQREAIELYRKALEADPSYAPAWARLGRSYRVRGKFTLAEREEQYRRAEESLSRALTLSPDLPVAHHARAGIDLDLGRPEMAIDRLLRVIDVNPNDPEGHAGLVTALRYLGLNDASLRAHLRARALDPEIPTSVVYTLESLGDLERAFEETQGDAGWLRGRILARLGREEEAIAQLRAAEAAERGNVVADMAAALRSTLEGDAVAAREHMKSIEPVPDPEGAYHVVRMSAHLGAIDHALEVFDRVVDGGYANPGMFAHDPWLDPLRAHPRFIAALARAEERHRRAVEAYGKRV